MIGLISDYRKTNFHKRKGNASDCDKNNRNLTDHREQNMGKDE